MAVKVGAAYEVLVLFMIALQTSCCAIIPTALPGGSSYLHYKRTTAWPGSASWDPDRAPHSKMVGTFFLATDRTPKFEAQRCHFISCRKGSPSPAGQRGHCGPGVKCEPSRVLRAPVRLQLLRWRCSSQRRMRAG